MQIHFCQALCSLNTVQFLYNSMIKGPYEYTFIIYLQRNTPDTTLFPTRKYKILYHATKALHFISFPQLI